MNDWNNRWEIFRSEVVDLHPFVKVDDFIHSSHISLKNKFFYAETPKVGCSTIKKLLIQAEFGFKAEFEEMEYIHFREFSPLINPRQVGPFREFIGRKDVFKFCFVRNPYTRLLSAYLDKIRRNTYLRRAIVVQLGLEADAEPKISFEDFIRAVCSQPVTFMDQHWRIQYYQTYQANINYDLVGKFESFRADLKSASRLIGLDFERFYSEERPHATGAGRKVRDYYTKELAGMVYEKYKIDFDTFEYERQLP